MDVSSVGENASRDRSIVRGFFLRHGIGRDRRCGDLLRQKRDHAPQFQNFPLLGAQGQIQLIHGVLKIGYLDLHFIHPIMHVVLRRNADIKSKAAGARLQ